MKITTWNVNGFRAVLNKGFRNWFETDLPDVLCLQEVKARPEQVDENLRTFDGYFPIWNPAERPGYSGVAVYSRIEPIAFGTGLEDPLFDTEGRVIWLQFPNFRLYNIYFPNGGRGMDRVDYKLRFYARLLEICDDLHQSGQNVILTGDFNTAHTEIDLANPKENIETSGFMPEERAWIDLYLQHGFKDVYRELYPERVQYTWWTYRVNARARNIGWRLDYYLVAASLLERIGKIEICDSVLGSDHCPVSMWID